MSYDDSITAPSSKTSISLKEGLIIKSLDSNYDRKSGLVSFLRHFFSKKLLKLDIQNRLDKYLKSGLLLETPEHLASSIIDHLWLARPELMEGELGGEPTIISIMLYALALELHNNKHLNSEEVIATS